MKPGNFLRHGDVKIERIGRFPSGKRLLVEERVVARGEVTGHAHRIAVGDAEVFQIEDGLYLRVGQGGIGIEHEEHGRLEIPPGNYRIGVDREFDYLREMERQVVD